MRRRPPRRPDHDLPSGHPDQVGHRRQAEDARHAARSRSASHRPQQRPPRPPRSARHAPSRAPPGQGRRDRYGGLLMRVHDLRPAPGSTKRPKRVGRGIGGVGGKTAGRGTKGQRARNTVAPGFEGGQMPLKQRVPKLKGFNNPFRIEYQAINLDTIEASEMDEISPETLHAHGLTHKHALIKVLGRGELTRAVTVSAHAFSAKAREAITAAGGSVNELPLPYASGRPPAKGNQFANR